jgi:glycosyltransferase involved in cell wall biosynthesis
VSYKNFPLFAEAIAPLLNQDKTLKLVCAGGGGFNADEENLLAKLNITTQCRQTNATDAELKQLYAQAQVFVFPSLIEGFGIPLLEAFSAGCPVAASNNTCFPEIGGDAIAYFDPTDKESIYNSIQSILSDNTTRYNFIKKGYERLKLFSIEKQVRATLNVYREVASK